MDYDGSQPLPDSDLTVGLEDDAATQQVVETTTQVTKKPSRSWVHEGAVSTVTDNGVAYTFDLSTLPEKSRAHLTQVGLTVLMSRVATDELNATFDRLIKGEVAAKRGGRQEGAETQNWRKAAALALVEGSKKSNAPLTLDKATEMVAGYTKETMKGLRYDALVVKHFNKLSGGTVGVSIMGILSE